MNNIQADKQIKQRLKKTENHDIFMSFQYLNKRIEEKKIEKWNLMWQKNLKKSNYYRIHCLNSQQTFFKKKFKQRKIVIFNFYTNEDETWIFQIILL